ncbi:hypothetical protein [Pseudomonas sp. NPDC087614]|uniref:hypothetical protein n=1 Tax=Pseudomonas sp. NPDC087614 TaxID=3364442 RepID=UPI00382C8EC4
MDNSRKKSALLSIAFLAATAIGYSSLSMASNVNTDHSVRGVKAVYAEDCKEADKRDGRCTQR